MEHSLYSEPEKEQSQQPEEEGHLDSSCSGVAHQLCRLLTSERRWSPVHKRS